MEQSWKKSMGSDTMSQAGDVLLTSGISYYRATPVAVISRGKHRLQTARHVWHPKIRHLTPNFSGCVLKSVLFSWSSKKFCLGFAFKFVCLKSNLPFSVILLDFPLFREMKPFEALHKPFTGWDYHLFVQPDCNPIMITCCGMAPHGLYQHLSSSEHHIPGFTCSALLEHKDKEKSRKQWIISFFPLLFLFQGRENIEIYTCVYMYVHIFIFQKE